MRDACYINLLRFLGCIIIAVLLTLPTFAYDTEVAPFSPTVWKQLKVTGPGNHTNREDEFKKFLHDYNLIGMTQVQVIDLLGSEEPDHEYLISSGFDSYLKLQIKYESDRVQGWRFWTMRSINNPPTWQTTNVLWKHGYHFTPKI